MEGAAPSAPRLVPRSLRYAHVARCAPRAARARRSVPLQPALSSSVGGRCSVSAAALPRPVRRALRSARCPGTTERAPPTCTVFVRWRAPPACMVFILWRALLRQRRGLCRVPSVTRTSRAALRAPPGHDGACPSNLHCLRPLEGAAPSAPRLCRAPYVARTSRAARARRSVPLQTALSSSDGGPLQHAWSSSCGGRCSVSAASAHAGRTSHLIPPDS
jgi:hypothetical protein